MSNDRLPAAPQLEADFTAARDVPTSHDASSRDFDAGDGLDHHDLSTWDYTPGGALEQHVHTEISDSVRQAYLARQREGEPSYEEHYERLMSEEFERSVATKENSWRRERSQEHTAPDGDGLLAQRFGKAREDRER
jgi:hypothetical protein